MAFYTELIRQWAITYGSKSQEAQSLEEEALVVRKFLRHVDQICLAALVVLVHPRQHYAHVLIHTVGFSRIGSDSRCNPVLL
jgi:hypothetical protein